MTDLFASFHHPTFEYACPIPLPDVIVPTPLFVVLQATIATGVEACIGGSAYLVCRWGISLWSGLRMQVRWGTWVQGKPYLM